MSITLVSVCLNTIHIINNSSSKLETLCTHQEFRSVLITDTLLQQRVARFRVGLMTYEQS